MQIVEKRSGVRRIVEHVGSAHDELGLALLMQQAREKLATGQDELDLGVAERLDDVEVLLAGDAEDALHALVLEGGDKKIGAFGHR